MGIPHPLLSLRGKTANKSRTLIEKALPKRGTHLTKSEFVELVHANEFITKC